LSPFQRNDFFLGVETQDGIISLSKENSMLLVPSLWGRMFEWLTKNRLVAIIMLTLFV